MQQSVLATQMKLQHTKKYNYLKYVHVCSSIDSAQFFVVFLLRLKCDQVLVMYKDMKTETVIEQVYLQVLPH